MCGGGIFNDRSFHGYGPVSGSASDGSLYWEDALPEMRACVHVYGGRSSWPGRAVQHEFGFYAGRRRLTARRRLQAA